MDWATRRWPFATASKMSKATYSALSFASPTTSRLRCRKEVGTESLPTIVETHPCSPATTNCYPPWITLRRRPWSCRIMAFPLSSPRQDALPSHRRRGVIISYHGSAGTCSGLASFKNRLICRRAHVEIHDSQRRASNGRRCHRGIADRA